MIDELLRFFLLVLRQRRLGADKRCVQQHPGVDAWIAGEECFRLCKLLFGCGEIALMHERLRQLEAGARRPGLGSVILRRGCRLTQKLDRFGVFAELDQCASLVISVRGLVQFRRSFDALARRPPLRRRRVPATRRGASNGTPTSR